MYSENVKVVAAQNMNFQAQDGNTISGTKIYFIRPCYDNELNRGWSSDMKLEHIFVKSGSGITVPSFPVLPCPVTFEYVPAGRFNQLSAIHLSPSERK